MFQGTKNDRATPSFPNNPMLASHHYAQGGGRHIGPPSDSLYMRLCVQAISRFY